LNVNIVNNSISYYENDFSNRGVESATIFECTDDDCDKAADRTTTTAGRRRHGTVAGEKGRPEASTTRLLQRIYWDRWRDHAAKSKASRVGCGGTNDKVDRFLSKIQEKLQDDDNRRRRKTKTESCKQQTCAWAKRTGNGNDRQQAKIDDQKKLLEKQRKEIERLKLQQLKLESEKALLENQSVLRELHAAGAPETRRKTRNAPPPPVQRGVAGASSSDIVNRMEVRALERRAKWEAIKERRRKAEQEEMRKKRELEEKCTMERMAQKRERLFEARENLRLRTIEEARRKAEMEAWRESVRIADGSYRKLLMRRGLEAFRVNLNCARWRAEEASDHYERRLVGSCFSKWRFYVNNSLNEKILSAEQFYKRKLMKTTFLAFYEV